MWTRAIGRAFCLAAALTVAVAAAGCRSEAAAGSYAGEVEPRLKQLGFEPWLPPGEGVEVGQIWSSDQAANRTLAFGRPAGLVPPPEQAAPSLSGLRDLTLAADAAATFADALTTADGSAGPAGTATGGGVADGGVTPAGGGPLKAVLEAAVVESAKVDLGPAFAREIAATDLDSAELQARLSGPYREALGAARFGSPRHLCVAGVVEVVGLTCTWSVESADRVAADLPRLNAALAGRGELSVPDKRTVRLRVPPSRRLAVGVRRLAGGAGFAAPAPPAAVLHNLDLIAGFDAAAGVRLGWVGGSRRAGLADRAAFAGWLARFRPQPGVDERVAELLAMVRAAPDATDPDPPHRAFPGTVRLTHRDVTTLIEAQRIVTEEAVRRGLATVEDVRERARIGS